MSENSSNDRPIFCFTKGNKSCDRALVVEGIVYRVHSKTLIQHSEYFRTMFTTDFVEKNQDEIELNEVSANEMKLFLTVLFKPETVDVTGEDLSMLCGVFSYFQPTEYFMESLKDKKFFDSIPPWKLLGLEKQYGIPELKNVTERMLIAQFNKKFPKAKNVFRPKNEDRYADVPTVSLKYDYFLDLCLDFVEEFGLQKLKARIEVITDWVLSVFNRGLNDLEKLHFIAGAKALRSDRMMKVIENILIVEYNKASSIKERRIIKKVVQKYELQNLKVDRILQTDINDNESEGSDIEDEASSETIPYSETQSAGNSSFPSRDTDDSDNESLENSSMASEQENRGNIFSRVKRLIIKRINNIRNR